MADPWKRYKAVANTTAGTGGTLTFDEPTPLDSTHLLVAIVQRSSNAALTNASTLTGAGWVLVSDQSALGSTRHDVWIKQGDGSTNAFTWAHASLFNSATLMAFEGYTSTAHAGEVETSFSSSGTSKTLSAVTATATGLAFAIVGLGNGGGGTWTAWTGNLTSIPAALSRLHIGVGPVTSGASVGSTVTHTSSRVGSGTMLVLPGIHAPATNAPPTVNAGADRQIIVGDSVSITATATDTDGTIAAYAWTVVSSDIAAPTLSGASTATVTLTPSLPSTVILRCTVEDNQGGSAWDEVSVVTAPLRGLPTDRGVTRWDKTRRGTIARRATYRGRSLDLGLLAQWDFTEAAAPFRSTDGAYALNQAAATLVTRTTSPWGYAASFPGSPAFLKMADAHLGALNLGLDTGQVTVAAWVYRTTTSTGFLGGAWQENNADPRRQYGLFVNLGTYGGAEKPCMHVSKSGEATPGYPFAREYSAGGTNVTNGTWQLHVGTYDGTEIRSYLNGAFTPIPTYTDGLGNTYAKNPFSFTDGLNSEPCEFTVGAVTLTAGPGNFFVGSIARLRVWNRALSPVEIANLYAAEAASL